jgi:sporulation protein YlmC with PRC-barrel domain
MLFASTATFAAEPGTTSTKSPSSTDTLTTTMPGDAVTVTNWYKQNVYDSSDNKIGEIVDVLMNKGGQVTTVILSVGGFLGMDTKDVAAPFKAIHATMKDNKWWLVMNTTKDALKTAPGYKYDKTALCGFRTNRNRHHIAQNRKFDFFSSPPPGLGGGDPFFWFLFSLSLSFVSQFAVWPE